ncbi:HvfC family RiPP maturation protein [Stenotrophomonas pigmentata]|uniref:HvfC family RiPP maturation protein n=1 Tax=Stenotrophomonas pigmentata TaxID=3055080 RepID=UPI0026EB3F24|nr:putative DNA-binding domain-containing protein [Stenotrophomonas sp. 610A2]
MAESLREMQMRFAAHLRDPLQQPAPAGIDDARMQVYRELYFNNIQSLLAANFPVITRTVGESRWEQLVRDFCREHLAHTPLFPEIGQEFIAFLDNRSADPQAPWLLELAHYEWIELALKISDEPAPAHDPDGDLLTGSPVCSPRCRALAYQWPVHQIGLEYQPSEPPLQPTLLLARREAGGSIVFSALSPLLYRLLERLEQLPELSGLEQLRELAIEAGAAADEDFLRNGTVMLQHLRDKGCLLGSLAPSLAPKA